MHLADGWVTAKTHKIAPGCIESSRLQTSNKRHSEAVPAVSTLQAEQQKKETGDGLYFHNHIATNMTTGDDAVARSLFVAGSTCLVLSARDSACFASRQSGRRMPAAWPSARQSTARSARKSRFHGGSCRTASCRLTRKGQTGKKKKKKKKRKKEKKE